MNAPAVRPFAPRSPARPRGFVFLVVLLLMVVGGILMVATLDRAAVQHALVEKQVEGYRRHHELLGVRDIVRHFLLKHGTNQDIYAKADTDEPVARMVLEGGQVVVIYLKDGQGTILRDLSAVPGDDPKRWLVDLLTRLPPNRDDLTRRSGPWGISLRAASDEVLAAIAAGDPSTTDALIEARDSGAKDISDVLKALEKTGSDALTTQALTKFIVFTPNLWRLDVELVRTDDTVHRYLFLVERFAGGTVVHEWRALPDSDQPPPGFAAQPSARSQRNGRGATFQPKTEVR